MITSADLVPAIRAKFEPKLLKHAQNTLVLNQFGMKGKLGKGENALTVTWHRRPVADSSRVSAITEGTNPSEATIPQLTAVSATLAQYGEWASQTDIAGYVALFNQMDHYSSILGEDAALHLDTVLRTALISGNTQKRYAGGASNFAGLSALTADQGRFTAFDGSAAFTNLRTNKTPKKNGGYYIVAAPEICHDLRQDPDWIDASKYAAPEQLLNGEIGRLGGIRYVETDNIFRETSGGTEGTFAASGGIFRSYAFGEESFGSVDLADQGATKPKLVILDKADKSDVLNLKIIIGWKAMHAHKVLNTAFFATISSKTTYA
jgi:N4-gp56 family major capsid protein